MPSKPSYRARPVTYLITTGLFLIVAIIALLLVRGYSFDPKSGALEKTGLIVLDSNPKNAFITVNNQVEPNRTRSTLKLSPGGYEVKVGMPGVHSWQKQIQLDPGEAALEENILLFRTEPKRTPLTPAASLSQSLSPSGKQLAFLISGPSGVTLSTVDATDGKNAQDITALPAEYAAPRSLSWSPEGSRVIVSAGNETRSVEADGQTITFPVGGRAAEAPQQSDAVIVESEPGVLVRARSGSTPSTEPYETGVTAWTVAGNILYAAKTDGSLVKHGGGNDRQVISRQPVLAELISNPDGTSIFGRTSDGTLYEIAENGLTERASGVERFAVSRDGNQVVYLKQRELRLWNRTDNEDLLLTRFTQAPERLAVIPGGHYVAYGAGGEIHVIAADGSNDTALAAGVELAEIVNREQLLVRTIDSGVSVSLQVLDR